MPSLAEMQSRVRDAVIKGDASAIVPFLVGGGHAERRLAIHRRHYETSLVTALLGKFPATAWLVGAPFLAEAARAFVRERPPHAPCIAEYGADFPEFLSARPRAERLPYLRAFAELEWSVSVVSIAIDHAPVQLGELASLDPVVLPGVVLTLQPGLRYLHAAWPVDSLMKLYLTDSAPDQFVFDAVDAWIQVRGARGAFDIARVDPGDFVFRAALLKGQTMGDAAARALEGVADFDPGRALAAVFAEGLVTKIVRNGDGGVP